MAEEMISLIDEQAYEVLKNSSSETYLMTDREFSIWLYNQYVNVKWTTTSDYNKEFDAGFDDGYESGYRDGVEDVSYDIQSVINSKTKDRKSIDLSKLRK